MKSPKLSNVHEHRNFPIHPYVFFAYNNRQAFQMGSDILIGQAEQFKKKVTLCKFVIE